MSGPAGRYGGDPERGMSSAACSGACVDAGGRGCAGGTSQPGGVLCL